MSVGPLPPDELIVRVGVSTEAWPTPEDRAAIFTSVGRAAYDDICSALPAGWSWTGKRVLDFGCGSGRVLRWFVPHIQAGCELVGCDIHAPTIDWMRAHYPPGVRVYVNAERPPLDERDATFDLICCGSVFSHLTEWAPWLLEMRRLLRRGGLLVASIRGRGFWSLGTAGSRGEPWDEDATGFLVERAGADFEHGWGPAVYASEWWLRAHWGRALRVVRFEPTGYSSPEQRKSGQAWIVAERTDDGREPTVSELEAPSEDPRELGAALRAQRLAYAEIATEHMPQIRWMWAEIQSVRAND